MEIHPVSAKPVYIIIRIQYMSNNYLTLLLHSATKGNGIKFINLNDCLIRINVSRFILNILKLKISFFTNIYNKYKIDFRIDQFKHF